VDEFLIDYPKSGKAWLLIGSGPSTAIGYPSWAELAKEAVFVAKSEIAGVSTRSLENAMIREDYPGVFDEAKVLLGSARLLQVLRAKFRSTNEGRIYEPRLCSTRPAGIVMA
jgi:hypothetical protein